MKFTYLSKNKSKVFNITAPGTYVFLFHNVSGEYTFSIKEEQVSVYLFGLLIGKGKQKFDLQTRQEHHTPNSLSELFIQSVMSDSSFVRHRGTISIHPHANGSRAYQKIQNLIISQSAYVESHPDLEIQANDVFCTHGSTTGGIPTDQKQYLQLRGLSEAQANGLIIRGRIESLFSRIREIGCSKYVDQIAFELFNKIT